MQDLDLYDDKRTLVYSGPLGRRWNERVSQRMTVVEVTVKISVKGKVSYIYLPSLTCPLTTHSLVAPPFGMLSTFDVGDVCCPIRCATK